MFLFVSHITASGALGGFQSGVDFVSLNFVTTLEDLSWFT